MRDSTKKVICLFVFLITVRSSIGQIITTIAGGDNILDGGLAINTVLYSPKCVNTDLQGNLYIADTYNNRVRKINKATGIINTIAGTGIYGFSGDGGLATNAQLQYPSYVLPDSIGNIYISESNFRIRKIDAVTGIITTIAGTGISGFSGDGGLGFEAKISEPKGLALDKLGNLYFADGTNNRIRKISAKTGIISTIAGNGNSASVANGSIAATSSIGYCIDITIDSSDNIFLVTNNSFVRKISASTGAIVTIGGNGSSFYSGDGGQATSAGLAKPRNVAVDLSGNVYISETSSSRIRKIAATTGIITTIAGTGTVGFIGNGGLATNAQLNIPDYVSLDRFGNLYVAESSNHSIRKIVLNSGIISAVSGGNSQQLFGDGNLASASNLVLPNGLAIDTLGNIYVADFSLNSVRKINGTTNIITTIVGNGLIGKSGDGGDATLAQLSNPVSVRTDTIGNIYIVDVNNNNIRKIDAATGVIATIAGNLGQGFAGDGDLATNSKLTLPNNIAIDAGGDIYISDFFNNRIRKITATTGIITTIVGNGTAGFSGDGGLALNAMISAPRGVAVDKVGNIYITDGTNRIRRIDKATNVITTIAGTGVGGYSGDGGLAINAQLFGLGDIILDPVGNIYFCDRGNHCVRKITVATGVISTVAGVGGIGNFSGDGGLATNATCNYPIALAFDKLGNLYIADYYDNRIRKVTNVATLPLNLLTLTAQQQQQQQQQQSNTVNLAWQTANEVNTAHFTIQRSVDGTNFNEIGKVAAKGDGGYSYTDNQLPNATVVYYRLQMVDKDGSFTYSKIVSCQLSFASKSLAVYPNPVKDHLFVQLISTKAEKITLQVTDLQGRILQQEDTQVGVGNVSLSVNTSTLAKGSYILLVKCSGGVQQKQFVKE